MPSRRSLLALLLLFAIPARAHDLKPMVGTPPLIGSVAPPTVPTAAATFVLDLDTSRVLEATNADQRMFPASTTKLMTCLVACERGKLNQVIRAGKNTASTGESGIGLLEGESHTLAELIQAALVHSANDACVDIAEGVGGNQKQFVSWMNAKAKELGCKGTHFMNPHGLHDPNHYTTAHDLAIIGRAALQVPFINETVRQKTVVIGGNWKIGPSRVLTNRNKLLWRWDACDGLKTGYTRQAGNCLVASATQPDPTTGKPWRLIAVAMKTHAGQSWPDCELLLKTAFASYRPQLVAHSGEIMSQGTVKGGAFPLEAIQARDVRLPLLAGESQTLSHKVHLFDLSAPINKGRIVGHVEYFAASNGVTRRIADLALNARDDVPQTLLARTIPSVGNHVGVWSFALRLAVLGIIALIGASILLLKRNHHARRRSHSHFRNTALQSREPGARTNDAHRRTP